MFPPMLALANPVNYGINGRENYLRSSTQHSAFSIQPIDPDRVYRPSKPASDRVAKNVGIVLSGLGQHGIDAIVRVTRIVVEEYPRRFPSPR
jgi:hypothetical protein